MQGQTVNHALFLLTRASDYFTANIAFTCYRKSFAVYYSKESFKNLFAIENHLLTIKDKPVLYEEIEAAKCRGLMPKAWPALDYHRKEQEVLYHRSVSMINQKNRMLSECVHEQMSRNVAAQKKKIEQHMTQCPQPSRGLKKWFGGAERYRRQWMLWHEKNQQLSKHLHSVCEEGQSRLHRADNNHRMDQEQFANQISWSQEMGKGCFDWGMSAALCRSREQQKNVVIHMAEKAIAPLFNLTDVHCMLWIHTTTTLFQEYFKNDR